MATLLPPCHLRFRKLLLLSFFFFLFTSPIFLSASPLDDDDEDVQPQLPKKKSTTTTSSLSSSEAGSSTKLSKPTISSPKKNQTTKLVTKKATTNSAANGDVLPSSTSSGGKKNQTKLITTTKSSNSTKSTSSPTKSKTSSTDSLLTMKKKPINSTADTAQFIKKKDKKQLNSTSTPTKSKTLQVSDPSIKQSTSPKNKTTSKSPATKSLTLTPNSDLKTNNKKQPITKAKTRAPPSWIDPDDDDEDLVAEFRDLPSRFHQHLIPDLERIKTTSRKYLNQANKEITKGFKPYVGNKYAPTIASFVSFAFILIPLLLVSLLVNRIKAYFSLQKLLIFVQVYLAIYFAILSLSALVTGLEPLRFFYATAGSTYFGLMLLQTLAYLLYLVLLLIYLALVFSPSSGGFGGAGIGPKMLGLAQALMGFAIGLHLYVAVFHRALLHQPPKTNWKVHGIYAACFLVVSLVAGAERRKKAYLEEGGEEGKVN